MILRIPIVTKSNYRDLKKLCEANVLGKDHEDYLRIIDQTLEHAKLLQIKTVRVNIDPPQFAHWLDGRKAKRLDLLHYADMIHRNPFNHDEPKVPASVAPNTERIERGKVVR